ncbi:MAG: IS3 family transposase [Marinifilaceae bacterium]
MLGQMYPLASRAKICRLFGKTRQAWYDHRHRQTNTQMQEVLILKEVQKIRQEHKRMGTEKLLYKLEDFLKEHKIKYGRDKLYALLGSHELLVRPRRTRPKTTNSNHLYRKFPNLIRDLKLNRSNHLWVSDITYLRTKMGFVYLSLITDAYSRKIVGWSLWPSLASEGALNALKMALGKEKHYRELIHHSDRGVQYCCYDYVNYLKGSNITISMTENGDPYENAIAERVNGILKDEYDLCNVFEDYLEANEAVKRAIASYNTSRPHSSCDFKTPCQAHTFKGEMNRRWTGKRRKNQELEINVKAKSEDVELG